MKVCVNALFIWKKLNELGKTKTETETILSQVLIGRKLKVVKYDDKNIKVSQEEL